MMYSSGRKRSATMGLIGWIAILGGALLLLWRASGGHVRSAAALSPPEPGHEAPLVVRGPLFRYVLRPEPKWGWSRNAEFRHGGRRIYDLRLVSQVWEGIPWRHTVRLILPPRPIYRHISLLYITGGEPNEEDTELLSTVSLMMQAPAAVLYNIPNQPLFGGLKEDDLIAHTFVKFLETGDDTWPLLLPMTKSAVKAMDALQQFCRDELGLNLREFVVCGGSKRGWTTWLTAVVDDRVRGIAPFSYDNLNIPAQMRHQIEVWGRYSEQIEPYVKRGLLEQLDSERGRRLVRIVDPYFYLDRLKAPKLIVVGTNDRYWTLDALNLYWADLPGEKWVLYVPNSGHGLEDRKRVLSTLVAFFHHVAGGLRLPEFRWKHEDADGKAVLRLWADPPPKRARLWVAVSKSLDFREARWKSFPMRRAGGGWLIGEVGRPKGANLALFGEAEFKVSLMSYNLSTTLRVVRAEAGRGK